MAKQFFFDLSEAGIGPTNNQYNIEKLKFIEKKKSKWAKQR